MKIVAALVLFSGMVGAVAADRLAVVTINGAVYSGIQDVHVGTGGKVVILDDTGGITVSPDQVPPRFLQSWGITPAQLSQSKAATEREAAAALDQAIRAGLFREVDGVVYDLRKAEAGWVQLSGLRVLQVTSDGALVQEPVTGPEPVAIYIHNLPPGIVDNQTISIQARLTQPFHYLNRFGYERTIPAYDAGRICHRDEIPAEMLRKGLAMAALPGAPRTSAQSPEMLPDGKHIRGIGSAFFVTPDGYLVTDFHVVKDSPKIEIEYKDRALPAKVIQTDTVNDLAVIKVEGNFQALAFAPRESAELGDSVFTIGFPNIEMQGIQPKYTDGKISSLAGIRDDETQYQISVPVQPGNSGGPLCDSNGDVVGIVVARLNDLAVLQASGVVPQNVNYAVKAAPIRRLLQHVKGLVPVPPRRNAGNPVKAVEDAVAMVLVY